MLCPVCHGRRLLEIAGVSQPCGGMGEIHCCDGLICQPEPAAGYPGYPAALGRQPGRPCEPPHPEAELPRPMIPVATKMQ